MLPPPPCASATCVQAHRPFAIFSSQRTCSSCKRGSPIMESSWHLHWVLCSETYSFPFSHKLPSGAAAFCCSPHSFPCSAEPISLNVLLSEVSLLFLPLLPAQGSDVLNLPVDGRNAVRFQKIIGLAEVPASEKTAGCG